MNDAELPPEEPPARHEDVSHGSSRRSRLWIIAVVGIVGLAGSAGFLVIGSLNSPTGDPGALTEELFVSDGSGVRLVDATANWGLDAWANGSSAQLAGGVAIGDVNGDGRNDIAVAGGDVIVFVQTEDGFSPLRGAFNAINGASSVGLSDVDSDGWLDLMVGSTTGDSAVVWGGEWWTTGLLKTDEVTWVSGGDPTTGMLAADLEGSGLVDIVRLGYGANRPTADVVFIQVAPRRFEAMDLPFPERKSLAAEIADVDGDGSLDIWITRDVGWESGADSVWSSASGGLWVDIAPSIGTALEVDGRGVTLADLNGDGLLDAYVSDLGDNEVLAGSVTGFTAMEDSGALRIRPVAAPGSVVSSSWASGVTDLNGDAVADLVVVNGGFPGGSVANKVPGTSVLLDDPPAVFVGLGQGRYADVWPGLGLSWSGAGRGLSIGDLDSDGDADIAVVRKNGGITVFRNDAAPGDGRRVVRIVSDVACDPSGAVVTVITVEGRVQRILGAHSFLGAHAPELSVGSLGEARVVVDWADGSTFESLVGEDDPAVVVATCA